jgi:hypothetical protein
MGRHDIALERVEAALHGHPRNGPLNMERAYCLIRLRPDLEEEIRESVRAAERAGLTLPPELRARLER